MPLSAGQVINNRYRIRSTLGQSRQEVVYSAWDISLNSPVAIQEILNTSPDCIQEFGYEARRLANLRHPGLPYVVDHFNLPGQGQYLILEYIDGKDLQSLINRSGKGLQWAQVVSWFGQVGEALVYLHSQTPPIIHREVKPANIKIIPSGQAMLVGNGIARSADPGRRATFVPSSGSVAFLSPEFFAGESDVRSDIYSFGATLYITLTGCMPIESLKRQAGQPLTPPRQINPAIPPGIEQAILKAMQLAPEGRFQSVREMLAALGVASGAGYPVAPTVQVPKPEAVALPARQGRSSGRLLGVIIGVLALCLLGGILGGLGIYSYVVAPSQTAAKQTDIELVKTATALYLSQLASPTLLSSTTENPPESATPSQTPNPTLTSVPAQLPSPTLAPSPTLFPSPSPSLSPTSKSPANPTWVPCPSTYPSQLQVGIQAFVSYDPPLANRVRTQPNGVAPVVGFIQPGEQVSIIGGPICSDDWIWWQVRSLQSGMTGWTAEGDKQGYWLVPSP
jgi:eukaryotic-like serine/threonine-protein kinase